MQHLHQQGLIHGDLYAHNILWNDSQVVLSDLGGASFLPVHDKKMTEALMQLDKRAYQVLLDELATITSESTRI
ncbi:MAG TPA: lipopolysaccharide kinase InaA family protein, partial [Methylophilaceae bacterium]|nr:lipopolysaccharide kinase InaA family protein [Methylophilaceae bacterium]